MLTNYLKIAFRNLWKSKGYSGINIFGLAIGLATCLLITLYVKDELSYDRFNKKASRIYRVDADIRFGGTDLKLAVSSDPMGATLKKDYPEVEQYTRVYNSDGSKLIKKGTAFITEQNVANADSTFFDVFTLPAIAGDTKTALNEPNTVVITSSTAHKYFGTTEALGKMIETDRHELYKVTAVIKDFPANSHFHLDFIFSMKNVHYQFGTFLSHNFFTYIVLKEGTDPKVFEKIFKDLTDRYILPQAKQFMQIGSMEEFTKAGNRLEYHLMPLLDIHLRSDRFPELGTNGNIQYVYIFSAVAIFILLIACINFMNLSTARSANRAKEVGIRKVLGTERRTLIQQFLTESTLVAIISLLIGLVIAWVALPYFNTIANKSLGFSQLVQPGVLPFVILLPFIVGILAGSYPAFFLSSFKPIVVLKGKLTGGFKRSTLRSGLVVFQFFISILLIIGTIVIYRQIDYIQNKNLGFKKEQVLTIHETGALGKNSDAFKNEVLALPGVKSGTYSGFLPITPGARNDNTFSSEAVMTQDNGFNMQVWRIDYDYINTLGMEIIKGRNFSRDFRGDSTGVIINETTAGLLGPGNPIGKKLYTRDLSGANVISYDIVGVVKNFNFESLRQNISPLCMIMGKSNWTASFKINTSHIKDLIANIESKWKQLAPGMPFSYQFLDQGFDNMYRTEQRIGKLAISFAILAIFIACLGLFGLVTFAAEQRTKEIGIRKVLGATVNDLVSMLSKDFLKLVAIASLIAFPFAWWAMSKWLEDFAYRVNISWWIFAAAGFIAVVIALATVYFQAMKAALANPVKSLRNE